ncbi:MAG: hypothetical protein Q4E74_00770 [Ruminococcus sp.]|nr:hypothetical protein [Ruminococcus sp.]
MNNENFKKFFIKEIKRNEVYVARKKKIGKIVSFDISLMKSETIHPVTDENGEFYLPTDYYEYNDYFCTVNGEKSNLSLIFRIFSNGDFKWMA